MKYLKTSPFLLFIHQEILKIEIMIDYYSQRGRGVQITFSLEIIILRLDSNLDNNKYFHNILDCFK